MEQLFENLNFFAHIVVILLLYQQISGNKFQWYWFVILPVAFRGLFLVIPPIAYITLFLLSTYLFSLFKQILAEGH